MYTEAVARGADVPLLQGDVIESTSPSATPWSQFLLVVTADCDLANAKHAGRVTCVPLLASDDYLLQLHFVEQREEVLARHVREFNEEIRRRGRGEISPDRIIEWVHETSSTEEIVSALDIDLGKADRIREACDGIRLAIASPASVEEAVKNLLAAQRLHQAPASDKRLSEAMRDKIRKRFESPPGDALFLRSIAPGYEDGYFAYLRHIEQVLEPDIAISANRELLPYRRIGALNERFAHAVVQRFAMVFMPIGLPVAYEEGRNRFANDIGRTVP